MILGFIGIFVGGVIVGILIGGLINAASAGDIWQAGFQAGLDAPEPGGREEADNRRFYEGLPLEDRR